MTWAVTILGHGVGGGGGARLPDGAVAVFVVAAVVFGLISIGVRSDRSLRMLDEWAERNGYRFLNRESRWMFRGPFFWSSGKSQTVYRIAVVDREGNRRDGWARCGGFFLGTWSSQVEVRWDVAPPPRPEPPGFPVVMPGGRPPVDPSSRPPPPADPPGLP